MHVQKTRADPGPTDAEPRDPQALGRRIRLFREEAGMSMRKLAAESGLSAGFLSQVERGLSSIALSSLHSIASALNRRLADFFEDDSDMASAAPSSDSEVFMIARRSGVRRTLSSGARYYDLLSPRVQGLVLEPMLVYIEPGGTREPAAGHDGEEFAYVLEGQLVYEVNGEEHRLEVGDSLYLRSSAPHSIYNDGSETCVVVSVVTPRHY